MVSPTDEWVLVPVDIGHGEIHGQLVWRHNNSSVAKSLDGLTKKTHALDRRLLGAAKTGELLLGLALARGRR